MSSRWTTATPPRTAVQRTYTGVDGYCPLAVYLGSCGYCLELALRPGSQHSVANTDENLLRVIPMAQRLSARSRGKSKGAPIASPRAPGTGMWNAQPLSGWEPACTWPPWTRNAEPPS